MNFHILTMHSKKKTINLVFHIPIPSDGTNEAGLSWREAIVYEQRGAENINSVLADITPEEESFLKSGALFEKQLDIRFSSTFLTDSQRLEEIKAAFTEAQTTLLALKQLTLAWIGYSGNTD